MIHVNSENILKELQKIVGSAYASNKQEDRYIYSHDPGASLPRPVDFIVLPKTVMEVQKIIKLANKEKIPIVPMGGGLTLSGLIIPVRGGIVMDMKRMNEIIEINKSSRYVLLEAGVTTGQLLSYLNNNHPNLQPPIPDSPPSATIAGNVLIHGSGYLSQKHGDHGSMINGLEVVLPNGDLGKFGSCAISDYWFTRGPIPDFIGLFTSSFGTLGVITKLSIKLYPKPKFRDIAFGLLKETSDIPKLLLDLTATDLAEDILLGMQDKPEWMKGYIFVMTYVTGNTEEEILKNIKILKKIYRKANARFMKPPPRMKETYLEKPIFAAGLADVRKGGGFEYVGAFMPLERVPEAYVRAAEISRKFGIPPTIGSRLMSGTHTIIVFFSYSFNRANPNDMENARKALHETNKLALKLGGIPWKVELDGQQLVMQKLNPIYKKLLKTIRTAIDPNGIMNPGNWEG